MGICEEGDYLDKYPDGENPLKGSKRFGDLYVKFEKGTDALIIMDNHDAKTLSWFNRKGAIELAEFIKDHFDALNYEDRDVRLQKGDLVTLIKEQSQDQISFGNNADPKKRGVEVGKVYEVEWVEVHSYHTKIGLVGVEGKFNDVGFKKINR